MQAMQIDTDFAAASPAVRFVEQTLTDAIHRQASDIHCEPLADGYRIRYRIDGLLHEILKAPLELASAVTCRLKVMSQCDISERRLPQDGRFTFGVSNEQSRECRLSTCPTLFGEKIVIRLLDSNKKILSMDELGLNGKDKSIFLKSLDSPQGLILVTGPTGSGKTITLYTALSYLNRVTHNIATVEEPVEIQLPGINQVNINDKSGLGFAAVLRAFLRQDPDILMVGEIRDQETANIAIRAAQTGHLVLATLHTNSAAATFTRLINMGIAPFNVMSSVRLIIAQRLVRKLCDRCKVPNTEICSPLRDYLAKGCEHCAEGYQGRTGIFEFLPISKENAALLSQQSSLEQQGIQTLWRSGLEKVSEGITSLQEIYRVVGHET
jgi:type IV pilus assembly protein PilB